MIMQGSLLFLGTGSSMGVPVIGCDCEVCRSPSPFNKRFRPGALLKIEGKKLLIDAGPDLRMQALQFGLKEADGVIITHAHHDHTGGIDDLRAFYLQAKQSIPCLLSEESAQEIRKRFHYMFEEQPAEIKLVPRMQLCEFKEDKGTIEFLGIPVQYFTYYQLNMKVNGYRFGSLAYITDLKSYTPDIFESLKGIKTLVISALRFTPSHMHISVDEAVDFVKQAGAEQAWLIHTAHELDYEKTNSYLPSNIRMAYDGLEIIL